MAEEKRPLISICIPTCKREEIVDQLIASILRQNAEQELYEVRITDNSDTDETKNLIEKKYADIPNLYYKKVTCQGFMNSVEALRFGQGQYLKLHNDYSILNDHALSAMIREVEKAKEAGAFIFFTLGAIKNQTEDQAFFSYDAFMKHINYQATWSSAFGIWKKDFDRIEKEGIIPDSMFPHTSYLHHLTDLGKYVVNNDEYATNIPPKKKGGYNLVDNFVRIYLTMVQKDLLEKNLISSETYDIIEKGILRFAADWYYIVKKDPDRYTYRFENDREIVKNTCGAKGLRRYMFYRAKCFGQYAPRLLAKKVIGAGK